MINTKLKKYSSVPAYKERCHNFYLLKNGLIKKYVDEALDLEDRQQQSLFHLTDGKSDDFTYNSGYFHACTGFGKTYLIKAMAEGYFADEKSKKIIILEENINILKQIKNDLLINSSFNEDDIGTYYGAEKSPDAPILVATYASMAQLLKAVKKEEIGLVLCDEAHHILSLRRQEIATNFDHAALYGFTATPHYNNDKECAQVFGNIIDSVTIRKGVESDLLCSFKNGLFVSHIPLDITEAKMTSGEYDPTKLAQILRDSHLHGMREELADFYLKTTDKELGRLYGKTTLINVPSQEEADILAEVFNEKAGKLIAKSYHTNTNEAPLQEFNNGEFPVLIQVNKLSEGYNNKNIEICINYPTGSKVRSAQRSGRALRRDDERPDKLALIVDVAFKRRQSGDILQEIHDNGQVLFMDVAEEGAIYSESYRKAHPEIELISSQVPSLEDDETNDKNEQKSSQFLFDIMTDYRDIYKLIYRHMELEEMRLKQPYDLARHEFTGRFDILKDGHKLLYVQREKIFNELLENPQFIKRHIVKQVQSFSGKACWTVDARRLSDLEKELNLTFVPRDAKEFPLKQKTDIMKEDFVRDFYVFDNDKEVSVKSRRVFFDKLCDNEELLDKNLIRLVRSGSKQAYAIDGTRLDEFLAVSGVRISDKPEIAQKAETDISKEDFVRRYYVVHDGKTLSKTEKGILYTELMQNKKLLTNGLIKTVIAKNLTIQVLDGSRLEEFSHLTGLKLQEKVKARSLEQEDITRNKFIRADYIVTRDGKQLVYQERVRLIAKLLADLDLQKQGIIVSTRVQKTRTLAINGKKIDELFALTGIKIEKRQQLVAKDRGDINLTNFRTDFVIIKDNVKLNYQEKNDLFYSLCTHPLLIEKGIIKEVHSNGHPIKVIDANGLDMIFKITGYQIQNKSEFDAVSFNANSKNALQNYIGKEDFIRNYVVTMNGNISLNNKERARVFLQLIHNPKLQECGIVKKTYTIGNFAIDSSRFEEIKALTGIAISPKEKLPEKLNSDISKTEFVADIFLEKDGKRIGKEDKAALFNQFVTNRDKLNGIIKFVKAETNDIFVIDGNRLDEFEQLTGYTLIRRDKTSLQKKEKTDIIPTYFVAHYQITDNGQILSFKQKRECFKRISQDKKLIALNIVKKVQSGAFQTLVVDGVKLDKLFELTGIKLTPLNEVERKKETDIDSGDFANLYKVFQDEHVLSILEKNRLFKRLTQDEELRQLNIIKFVHSAPSDLWVIDGDKLDELQKLRKLSISQKETYPKQQETDITLSHFATKLKVIQNGKVVTRDNKKKLFEELSHDSRLLEHNLIRMVQSPYVAVMMIDGTRLSEIEEITGLSIQKQDKLPKRETTDIIQSDFGSRYGVVLNGENLNKQDRLELFDTLSQNEELLQRGIIKKVKMQRHEMTVIDGTKLDELQQITGLRVITPQHKLSALYKKLEQAQTDEEKQKYHAQIRSMFQSLKKRNIAVALPDKQKD